MTGRRSEVSAVLSCAKRKLRSLFWRMKVDMRRQVLKSKKIIFFWSRNKKNKQRFSFQYDPLSYALNFDDGNFGFLCQ